MGIIEYEKKVKKAKTSDGSYSGYFDGKNRTEKPLGFCHYENHRGYVSVDLLKKHNCLGKNCPHLSKYEDSPYFVDKARGDREKQLKKQGLYTGKTEPLICSSCGRVFKACNRDTAVTIAKRARSSKWQVGRDIVVCNICKQKGGS